MTRVLVLYYSSYGRVRALAQAEAEGARSVPGTHVDLRRMPEAVPDEVRRKAGFPPDDTPIASHADLDAYDAIIFGTPTVFGMMAGQMKSFLDQAGGLTLPFLRPSSRPRRRIPRGLSPHLMRDIGLEPWPDRPRVPFQPLS